MNKHQARDRIEKLRKLINHHRYLYHVLDRQEISEAALDSLKKELFDLEELFPHLITSDSPTQRIGGRPLEKFVKVRHPQPMLSLNDAFSKEDLENWFARIAKLLTKEEATGLASSFYCEPKLDGLAIELIYENGILKTGSTRGDGIFGEDVTQNLKTIEAIPLRIGDGKNLPKIVVVRGEAIIAKKDFERVNKNQEKQGLSAYANPRNLAAGSIRQLDPKITASRHLDAHAYDLLTNLGQETHQQEHRILEDLGFKTNNEYSKHCQGLKEVLAFHDSLQKNRDKLSYEVDGVFVTANSNRIFEKLGVVGKAPRGAIAFKFSLKQATTVLEDVSFQVGRTGAITPVAILKPVKIAGVTISRATLHNQDEIKRLGAKIKDTVVVGRAGDVIPDIIKVLPELRTGKEKTIIFPKTCPVCPTRLVKVQGEVVWRCPNPKCRAVQREYFYHFVSKNAFDIQGLGPKIIDRFCDQALIQNPSDLFSLKPGDIAAIERFGEKSAGNLISAVQSKKKITFPKFILALGIRNVGEETSQDLAEFFGSLENLKKASLDELLKIQDIGPIVAQSIYQWFKNERNLEFLEKLEKAGIEIEDQKPKTKNQKLRDLIFVFTGELKTMTRQAAKERIRELGGEVSESVSGNTNFVVAGVEPGSKLARARKLGVKTLTELEFLKIVG